MRKKLFKSKLNHESFEKCLFDQECFLMVVTLTHTSVNSVFYSAATAVIRYVYIKTSLQANIQATLKRTAFMWKSVFIVESLGCYNLLSFYLFQRNKRGTEKNYHLLYQACLNPWEFESALPLVQVMPFNQILIHVAAWCIVVFNIVLYKHLAEESRNNSALSSTDQIKIRRRNIVPARVGTYSLLFMFISLPTHTILYSLSIDLGQTFYNFIFSSD